MNFRILGFLAIAAVIAVGSKASAATYHYSGVPDLSGGYINATVEVNCGVGPCSAGTYLYSSGITSYSLFTSVGALSLSSTDPGISQEGFNIYMIFNGAGEVTNWFLLLKQLASPETLIYTIGNDVAPPSNCPGCNGISEDFARDKFNDGFSITQGHPGAWELVATPAVPEPSTWAMMILGFCGLGFVTYRRKSKIISAIG